MISENCNHLALICNEEKLMSAVFQSFSPYLTVFLFSADIEDFELLRFFFSSIQANCTQETNVKIKVFRSSSKESEAAD